MANIKNIEKIVNFILIIQLFQLKWILTEDASVELFETVVFQK